MELMDFTSQVSVMAATLNVKSVTHCLFFTAGEPPPPPYHLLLKILLNQLNDNTNLHTHQEAHAVWKFLYPRQMGKKLKDN